MGFEHGQKNYRGKSENLKTNKKGIFATGDI